uniref:Putative lipocalin-2 1 n=1 Tax=Amblyomma cajennense TaxID=34607 RepID=A0A023FTJ9_AMBCJ
MNGFSIALLLALGITTTGAQLLKKDLYAAINTTGRVWTVQRTFVRSSEKGEHTCVYAWQVSLEGDKYQFEQHYMEGGKRIMEPLHGRLSDGDSGPVLTVSKEEGGVGIPYTLYYWDNDRKCGILKFPDQKTKKIECELHVWEDYLLKSPSTPCDHDYDSICGPSKHAVYHSGCLTDAK